MPEGLGPQEMLNFWQESQRVFWTAAASEPAFEDASAFAPPEWQPFDNLVDYLLSGWGADGPGPDLVQLNAASVRYRDVVSRAWMRIRTAFEAHRRAVWDPAQPPDWRVLRDRWFQTAEAEFIRTQRSEEFLAAQRDVIRAVVQVWSVLPAGVLEAASGHRRAADQVLRVLSELGIDRIPIAQTPKQEVWTEGRVTLSRYHPLDGRALTLGPVLICHGLIGRQTMVDLRPDRSLVRNLLASGVDVFIADWGNAGPEDAAQGLDHYVGEMIPRLIHATLQESGADRLSLFGICQGGTLAAMHAALDPTSLSGLITAVAPFDFHADSQDADPSHGLLNVWVRSLEPEDIEGLITLEGNLPGPFMGLVFNQLNPVRTLSRYAIQMPEAAADPAEAVMFLAMEKWLADRPDLPGALARSWLADMYRDNGLIRRALTVKGHRIDLSDIQVPVLNIYAAADHIIPVPCASALSRYVSKVRYSELSLPTGHIGAFVSNRTQVLLGPAIANFLREATAPDSPH